MQTSVGKPKLDVATLCRRSRGEWALDMMMDISSEMIHAPLLIYLVIVMGVVMLTVGIIEGLAEATVAIVKLVSRTLSDRLGKRKWPLAGVWTQGEVPWRGSFHNRCHGRTEAIYTAGIAAIVIGISGRRDYARPHPVPAARS